METATLSMGAESEAGAKNDAHQEHIASRARTSGVTQTGPSGHIKRFDSFTGYVVVSESVDWKGRRNT